MSNINYYALDEALAFIDGKELSLEFHINSLIESSKVFAEIDITALNEAEGDKSFKEKIVNALKKVIEKIKNFINWITTKVKVLWSKIKTKICSAKLKEKLKKAQERAKNDKVNEAASLVTEAKSLSELENWLNEKYTKPIIYYFEKDAILDSIEDGCSIIEREEEVVASKEDGKELILMHSRGKTTRKDFINFYENCINNAESRIYEISQIKKRLEDAKKGYEEALDKINTGNISNINDLKTAFSSSSKKDAIMSDIKYTSRSLTTAANIIEIITKIANKINTEVAYINSYLGE